jgi:hypothetical protein
MSNPEIIIGRIEFENRHAISRVIVPSATYRMMGNRPNPEGSILTKDIDGEFNGWLVPLWHVDSGEPISQVYLTVVLPYRSKGPHLHKVRAGRFVCLKGDVEIVMRENGKYRSEHTGEHHQFATVRVSAGTPAEICNYGLEPAYVLNMPAPPWRVDEQDEWLVEDWDPKWT